MTAMALMALAWWFPVLAFAMAEKPRDESDPLGRADRREREWYQ
jgi:hypothetical protein